MQNFHSIPLSGRFFFTLAIPRRWHDREGDRRTLNLNQAILSVCLWSIMDCITNQIQAIHAGYRPALILCMERYVDFFFIEMLLHNHSANISKANYIFLVAFSFLNTSLCYDPKTLDEVQNQRKSYFLTRLTPPLKVENSVSHLTIYM